ncbi:response regulator [Tsuneonella sp. HG249]
MDDEVLIRMTVLEELADAGYSCVEAANGKDGLRMLAERSDIALLVTDVGLPDGMSGRQLADTARESRPELPILFITGYADQAALAKADGVGGVAVLTKPFRVEELLATVRQLLAE